jgi:hypothetical protein
MIIARFNKPLRLYVFALKNDIGKNPSRLDIPAGKPNVTGCNLRQSNSSSPVRGEIIVVRPPKHLQLRQERPPPPTDSIPGHIFLDSPDQCV